MKPDTQVDTLGDYDIYAKEFHPYWWSDQTSTCYYAINRITGHKTLLYGHLDDLKDMINRITDDSSPESRVYKAIKGTSLDMEIAVETGLSLDAVKEAAEKLVKKNMVRMRTIKKEDGLHSIVTKIKR